VPKMSAATGHLEMTFDHRAGRSLWTARRDAAAPAHALPVEYMEGPFLFEGTVGGEPVRGFGISERSLALYRDWARRRACHVRRVPRGR
jgi:hypothetical protein